MTAPAATLLVLNAVILAVTDEVPRFLVLEHHSQPPDHDGPALPFGPFEPEHHRTLEIALRGWVDEQAGLPIGYVEQLYTFGDRFRDPRELAGGPRVISVGYLALVRQAQLSGDAEWRDAYDFLPWEDWRKGRPKIIDQVILPALHHWAGDADDAAEGRARRERLSITFAADNAHWDMERVLERYEVLYEAGLVQEADRDRGTHNGKPADDTNLCETARTATGRLAALDHRRMMATALGRIRGKLQYRPVVFELLPKAFTLLQLQQVAESLAGVSLHKQNFRRLVVNNRLVEPTGQQDRRSPGRPAELFRFRRDVLYERPTPGVGITARSGG
ncbi:MAG: hypothetical protein GKS00_14650 [Alphaproteobacteria bacterium]|nr:hypothetical protein [Alphaproteobacteria bacterium]